MALLVAQQFFVDQEGPHLDSDKLESSLQNYLPDFALTKQGQNTIEKWMQMIMHVFRKVKKLFK